jgi:hypothetical protein
MGDSEHEHISDDDLLTPNFGGNEEEQVESEAVEDVAPLDPEVAAEIPPALAAATELLGLVDVSVEDVCKLILRYPGYQDEILQLVASDPLLGNSFVREVVAGLAGFSAPTQAQEPPAAGDGGERGPGTHAAWELLSLVEVAPEEIARVLTRYNHEWDTICELVRLEKGEQFLADVLAILQPSEEVMPLLAEIDQLEAQQEGTEPAPPEAVSVEMPSEQATATPSEQAAPAIEAIDATITEQLAPEAPQQAEVVARPEEAAVAEPQVPETTVEAAPQAAPQVVEEAVAEEVAQHEDTWVTRARDYNGRHVAEVEAFDQATGGSCRGPDGEIDPNMVARWQVDHGVSPDGRVGPLTVAAANRQEAGKEPAPSAEAAPEEAKASPSEVPASANALAAQLSALDRWNEPIVCADAEIESAVGEFVGRLMEWSYLSLEAAQMASQLAADGLSAHPIAQQIEELGGRFPFQVEIQTELVPSLVVDWRQGIMRAYEDILAQYTTVRDLWTGVGQPTAADTFAME